MNTLICYSNLQVDEYRTITKFLLKQQQQPKVLETVEKISDYTENNSLLLLLCPNQYTETEFQALKQFKSNSKNKILVFGKDRNSNINYFLEEYGIFLNEDFLFQRNFNARFYDPKENLILYEPFDNSTSAAVEFVYCFGCSLTCAGSNCRILLYSSKNSYPSGVPLIARNDNLIVCGSVKWLSEDYINQLGNSAVFQDLLKISTMDSSDGPPISSTSSSNLYTSHLSTLCAYPRASLCSSSDSSINSGTSISNSSSVDVDVLQLFSFNTFALDGRYIEQSKLVLGDGDFQSEKLQLIKPKFELIYPEYQISIHHPSIHLKQRPMLELFDFDNDELDGVDVKKRLAQLFNTSAAQLKLQQQQQQQNQEDAVLRYFIREASKLVQQSSTADISSSDGTDVDIRDTLFTMLKNIIKWKLLH